MVKNGLIIKNVKLTFLGSRIPYGFDPIFKIPTPEDVDLFNKDYEQRSKNRRLEFIFKSNISLFDRIL